MRHVPLLRAAMAHGTIIPRPQSAFEEPNDRVTVFGKTGNGADHDRTPEDHTTTQDRGPKKQPSDNGEEVIVEAMVATGNAGKQRA